MSMVNVFLDGPFQVNKFIFVSVVASYVLISYRAGAD